MSKTISGKIVALKMAKTAVVKIKSQKAHPLYKKIIKRTKKLKAHIEKGTFSEGDIVEIRETKPISKTKHWIVVKKMSK